MVDEDAVGSIDRSGSGAKILHGDGALERYIADRKVKREVLETEFELKEESRDASRAMSQ